MCKFYYYDCIVYMMVFNSSHAETSAFIASL